MMTKKEFALPLILFIVLSFSSAGSTTGDATNSQTPAESIKTIIESANGPDGLWIGCEKIHAGQELIDFYRDRSHEPVWVNGPLLAKTGLELAETLASADSHGLVPEDYHLSCIQEWIKSLEERTRKGTEIYPRELAGLEIVMTDAFLNFGSHLADGKVDPESVYPEWLSGKDHKADVLAALDRVSENGSIAGALEKLATRHADYWGLVRAAQWLRTVEQAGGWPAIADGKTIHPGDRDPRVTDISRRLEMEGHLPHGMVASGDLYDKIIQEGVEKFQANNGLEIDGVIGKNTLEQMNVTAGERRRQILVNLERWRWLPRFLGDRHIRVNTASFNLEAVDKNETKLEMRVIVGKDFQKTPVFSKRMRYLEINPYWNVPRSIMKKELLPQFKKDPESIVEENYEIVAGWHEDSPVIDPSTIDWKTVSVSGFPGRIRQTPGPWNALGRIKFMFPNQFNVYLHDTPARKLFRKAHRALSHGCIRLEKPVDLALFVLQDNPEWDREKIEKTIEEGQRKIVGVPGMCTVHLMYYTAWMDENGRVQFRRDVYDRDEVLWKALNRSANGPRTTPVIDSLAAN